jgi:hypothetical protein
MTALVANPTLEQIATRPAGRSILSRIWPFSSRRVHHRTFGTLKRCRNGNYLSGRAEFSPLGKKIHLVIPADAKGSSHIQEKHYLQIEKHYQEILPELHTALFAEYEKVRRVHKSVPWPKIAGPGDLQTVIPLNSIWLEQGDGHPFVLSFQSKLDKDHEFHVFFRHGKLASIAFEN